MIKSFSINILNINADVYEDLIRFLKFNEFDYLVEDSLIINTINKAQSFRVNNYLKCKEIKFEVGEMLEVF